MDPDRGRVLLDGQQLTRCNLASVRQAIGVVSPDLPLLSGSVGENLRYRWPDASDEAVARVQRTLDRVYAVLRDAQEKFGPLQAAASPSDQFLAALLDDLNTPEALAELNNEARRLANAGDTQEAHQSAGLLLAAGVLIGLFQQDPQTWLTGDTAGLDDALIDQLIIERNNARKDRDFSRADEIRDQLQAMGITLEDVADGTRWRRAQE